MSQALLGIPVLLILAWLSSADKRRVPLRLVLSGILAQFVLAALFLKLPPLQQALLLIKPHLRNMSRSELFILMSSGMATVAGTVLGLYASILGNSVPEALSHLIVASLISAPAAIMLAAIMVPERRELHETMPSLQSPYASSMDAIVRGTGEGLRLLANIIGMLIVFVAMVYLADALLGLVPTGGEPLTLVSLFGYLFTPLAWLLGIPWEEADVAGEFLATKVFINELVAFLQLAALEPQVLSEHSRLILTYALCGFANFGSLGIMVGGMTALCPERAGDILRLAPRSIWSGLLATCMTACVVGLIA